MRWLSSFTMAVWSIAMLIALVSQARSTVAADAPATHKPSQKWALLIGVNDYAYINKLKYCGADMEALRGRLIEAGFPENHVYLLSDKAKDSKYQPNKTNIETQIDLVTKLVGKDDVLVLAFAGHGVHLSDVDYICPVDAKLDESKSSLVSLDTVYERVRKSPAALKIMLVDACRDDPTPGGKRSAADTAEENRKFAKRLENIPQGIVLLNSCSPGESSMEDAKLSHGVFTYFLLEGLAGKADANRDGVVTLSELAEYVGDQTKNHVASQWAYLQRPYLKGDLSLDAMRFDIGRVKPKAPKEPHAGDILTNSFGQKFAYIPAGEFQMGMDETLDELLKAYPYSDKTWLNDAVHQHRVRITKPFYLGIHDVTKGDFARFVSQENYKTDAEKDGKGSGGYVESEKGWKQLPEFNWRNAGFVQRDDHPVVNVSWNDALAYINWLSKRDGRKYRLPTEAEWEYACRAGKQARFFFGNDEAEITKYANIWDTETSKKLAYDVARVKSSDGYAFTSPVGTFRPNAFGLYDMHGNVWQWCADFYDASYYMNSPTDDPLGPASGSARVLRGGSWGHHPATCRSPERHFGEPSGRNLDVGFRIVVIP